MNSERAGIATRILTWNIQQGGSVRIQAIAQRIATYAADLAVISEYRNGRSGSLLRDLLADQGFRYQQTSTSAPKLNSVLIASRLAPMQVQNVSALYSHSLLSVETADMRILGCYFPQSKEKYPVFESLLEWCRWAGNKPGLVIGDLNTGKHHTDEKGATFYCAEYLDLIEAFGFTDAWRFCNGSRTEFSWYSNRGNGFRIDHAFLSATALPLLSACFYSHDERTSGASDHSLLVVDLRSRS